MKPASKSMTNIVVGKTAASNWCNNFIRTTGFLIMWLAFKINDCYMYKQADIPLCSSMKLWIYQSSVYIHHICEKEVINDLCLIYHVANFKRRDFWFNSLKISLWTEKRMLGCPPKFLTIHKHYSQEPKGGNSPNVCQRLKR